MASPKRKVLILCTGNSCRSQMAEAFLDKIAGDRYEALSAGLDPKESIHPLAVQVMAEIGIDISHQKTKGIESYLGKQALFALIVVCDKAQKSCPRIWPNLPLENRFHFPFEDPAEVTGPLKDRLAAFRRVRDEIRSTLVHWIEGIEAGMPDRVTPGGDEAARFMNETEAAGGKFSSKHAV